MFEMKLRWDGGTKFFTLKVLISRRRRFLLVGIQKTRILSFERVVRTESQKEFAIWKELTKKNVKLILCGWTESSVEKYEFWD